jgi:hypothetical protein
MPDLPLALPKLSVPDKVAVVGSGPGLRNATFGPEIDGFPCIIRFNRSPHEGWEAQVGSRTDIRYVNEGVFYCGGHPRYPKCDVKFMKRVRNTKIIVPWRWSQERHNQEKKNTHPSNSLYFIYNGDLPTFMVAKMGFHHPPTAGHAMIAMLLTIGVEVHAYGFSLDNNMGHYWEPRSDDSSPCHDIGSERAVWRSWRDTGRVAFHE